MDSCAIALGGGEHSLGRATLGCSKDKPDAQASEPNGLGNFTRWRFGLVLIHSLALRACIVAVSFSQIVDSWVPE